MSEAISNLYSVLCHLQTWQADVYMCVCSFKKNISPGRYLEVSFQDAINQWKTFLFGLVSSPSSVQFIIWENLQYHSEISQSYHFQKSSW